MRGWFPGGREVDQQEAIAKFMGEVFEVGADLVLLVVGVWFVFDGETMLTANTSNLHVNVDASLGLDDAFHGDSGTGRVQVGPAFRQFQLFQENLQKKRPLAMAGLRVQQVCNDARKPEFVGLEVVQYIESVREMPVQLSFKELCGIKLRLQPGKELLVSKLVIASRGIQSLPYFCEESFHIHDGKVHLRLTPTRTGGTRCRIARLGIVYPRQP